MTETVDEHIHRIIAEAGEIARDGAAAVRESSWMPQEIAAQLAEKTACSNSENRSEEWLDAWVAACEACAAEIRAYRTIFAKT